MRMPLTTLFLFAAVAPSCVHVTTCSCSRENCCDEREVTEVREVGASEHEAAAPAALIGVVRDERGRPAAHVPVRIYGGFATRWKTGETTTDAEGRFSFDEVQGSLTKPDDDGPWHQCVGVSCGEEVGGANPAAYLPWTDVTIAPGVQVQVDLVLDRREVQRRLAAERSR